ncbi:hypothetical protein P152DRAFT_451103 [Eremomyces bilateralis CBS 781.70]|uniref:Uncharacterized protein n=1 Tax=Eremomyces bilateralis CBS 781.70 TaxID=1392243 RepID=A0A6G1FX78_9PEZI|nr:uncharacterized protein P152DRAFT_451103 [Eremomyces bilateralis CBS 781.70]KAF1810348.1 hypothetical protein P152DRAFT_451103 [Eremomyces bilateralis CBS 781.70]
MNPSLAVAKRVSVNGAAQMTSSFTVPCSFHVRDVITLSQSPSAAPRIGGSRIRACLDAPAILSRPGRIFTECSVPMLDISTGGIRQLSSCKASDGSLISQLTAVNSTACFGPLTRRTGTDADSETQNLSSTTPASMGSQSDYAAIDAVYFPSIITGSREDAPPLSSGPVRSVCKRTASAQRLGTVLMCAASRSRETMPMELTCALYPTLPAICRCKSETYIVWLKEAAVLSLLLLALASRNRSGFVLHSAFMSLVIGWPYRLPAAESVTRARELNFVLGWSDSLAVVL